MHKYAPENPPGIFPPRRHNRTPSCAPSLSLLPQQLLLRLSLRKRADRMVGRGHADSRSKITSTSKAVDFIRLPKAYWREVLGRESAFPQRPGAGRTQTPVSGFSPAGKRFWPPWSSPGRGGRCVRSAAPSLLPPVTHTLGPPGAGRCPCGRKKSWSSPTVLPAAPAPPALHTPSAKQTAVFPPVHESFIKGPECCTSIRFSWGGGLCATSRN